MTLQELRPFVPVSEWERVRALEAIKGVAATAGERERLQRQFVNPAPVASAPDVGSGRPTAHAARGDSAAGSRTALDYALAYASRGWSVLPVDSKTKRPLGGKGIAHATTDIDAIRAWFKRWPHAGIGVRLDAAGLCAIDIDPRTGTSRTAEDFPATLQARTGGGGWHLVYQAPKGVPLPGKLELGVDIKWRGYIIVEPSAHPSGGRYTWVDFDPFGPSVSIADFPLELLKRSANGSEVAAVADTSNLEKEVARASFTAETRKDLRSALRAIPSDDRDLWVRIAHALKPLEDEGKALWLEWSKKSLKFDAGDAERVWRSARGDRTGYAAVFAEAQRLDWKNPKAGVAPLPKAAPSNFEPRLRSAADLINTEFKEIMFVIENLLPEGVFLLVASPKIGKSWLTLQFALAVASGAEVLGKRSKQGDALVLALEDGPRRLKKRLLKLNAELLPREAVERLQFETQWPRMDEGGAEHLERWLEQHPEARLIVVDVLEKVRPARDAKANAYGEDYKALQALKGVAERRQIAILVVHHTRKAASDDPMQLVSGTQGLAGAADGVLVLARARGETRGELRVMARDLENDGAFAVEFQDGRWRMLGPAGLVAKTATQRAILEALQQHGEPIGPTQLAWRMGRSPQSVQQALARMLREGLVEQLGGKYFSKNIDDLSVESQVGVVAGVDSVDKEEGSPSTNQRINASTGVLCDDVV